MEYIYMCVCVCVCVYTYIFFAIRIGGKYTDNAILYLIDNWIASLYSSTELMKISQLEVFIIHM